MTEQPADEYDGPERRSTARLVGEVEEMRAGINVLARRVEDLSKSLSQVNTVTAQQQEVDRRAAQAVFTAATALARVDANKKEAEALAVAHANETQLALKEANESHAAELHEQRHKLMRRIWLLATVVLVIAIVAVTASVAYTRGTERFQRNSYNVCLQRSDQAARIRLYLTKQAANINRLPPTRQAQARDDLNILLGAFPAISCDGLKP